MNTIVIFEAAALVACLVILAFQLAGQRLDRRARKRRRARRVEDSHSATVQQWKPNAALLRALGPTMPLRCLPPRLPAIPASPWIRPAHPQRYMAWDGGTR